MENIVDWDEIQFFYKDSLIVGNGASIAVNKNFDYDSLYKKASESNFIDSTLKKIFNDFKTDNFETVLHKLLQAKIVTEALSIDNDQITKAYEACRISLINVIQTIHPKYNDIDSNQFINISNFLKNFKTVISLNYDLILYWSMYHGNQPVVEDDQERTGHRFKDCFTEAANGDKCLNFDFEFLRQPHGQRHEATLIFYLHGNLSLADFISEAFEKFEVKITSPEADHLERIYEKWRTNRYSPLFVCEGEKNRKLTSIKESVYLSTIYNDIFKGLSENIAIYGWNMNDQDDHVIERLHMVNKIKPFKKIAVSVYKNGQESNFINRVSNKLHEKINKNIQIDFYNSASSKCWNNN